MTVFKLFSLYVVLIQSKETLWSFREVTRVKIEKCDSVQKMIRCQEIRKEDLSKLGKLVKLP